jgi:hypothetical protein
MGILLHFPTSLTSTLTMEAAASSENMVPTYQSTRCHNEICQNLNLHPPEILKLPYDSVALLSNLRLHGSDFLRMSEVLAWTVPPAICMLKYGGQLSRLDTCRSLQLIFYGAPWNAASAPTGRGLEALSSCLQIKRATAGVKEVKLSKHFAAQWCQAIEESAHFAHGLYLSVSYEPG